MTARKCADCRHYFKPLAECRRFPPIVYVDKVTGPIFKFPPILSAETYYCGEFEEELSFMMAT